MDIYAYPHFLKKKRKKMAPRPGLSPKNIPSGLNFPIFRSYIRGGF